jgi:DNA-binding NtrC family response regulator
VFGEVARGGFRGDLYYRLAVVEIHVPPLRQRKGDLERLVQMFLTKAGAAQLAAQVGGAALERLERYHWPGNVRELRNVITRAVALAGPDDDFQSLPFVLRPTVAAPDEPMAFKADRPFHEAKDEFVAKFEREYLTDLVARANGNLSQAARIAGLERKFLYKLLERAGLRSISAPGTARDEGDQ